MSEVRNWAEAKETKRLMSVLESLEKMVEHTASRLGTGGATSEAAAGGVSDAALLSENKQLKQVNQEALQRLDKVIAALADKVED